MSLKIFVNTVNTAYVLFPSDLYDYLELSLHFPIKVHNIVKSIVLSIDASKSRI